MMTLYCLSSLQRKAQIHKALSRWRSRLYDSPTRNRMKTMCSRGHPYDATNTRWYRGMRYCIACKQHVYRHRNYKKLRVLGTPDFNQPKLDL